LAYDEDVFIGYRAWNRADALPLFPFGHGAGYTTWSYRSIVARPGAGSQLYQVEVTLTNTGARYGREVVQLYLTPQSDGIPDVARPVRWLAGFAVAEADAGESVTVRIGVPLRAAQVWQNGWHTVPGSYMVEAAHSIADRRLGTTITV
jgi:beta-glucosidase